MGFDTGATQSCDLDVTVGDAGANLAGKVCDYNRAFIRKEVEVARSRNSNFKINRSLSGHFDFDFTLSVLCDANLRRALVIPGVDDDPGGIGAGRHLDRPRLIHYFEFAG